MSQRSKHHQKTPSPPLTLYTSTTTPASYPILLSSSTGLEDIESYDDYYDYDPLNLKNLPPLPTDNPRPPSPLPPSSSQRLPPPPRKSKSSPPPPPELHIGEEADVSSSAGEGGYSSNSSSWKLSPTTVRKQELQVLQQQQRQQQELSPTTQFQSQQQSRGVKKSSPKSSSTDTELSEVEDPLGSGDIGEDEGGERGDVGGSGGEERGNRVGRNVGIGEEEMVFEQMNQILEHGYSMERQVGNYFHQLRQGLYEKEMALRDRLHSKAMGQVKELENQLIPSSSSAVSPTSSLSPNRRGVASSSPFAVDPSFPSHSSTSSSTLPVNPLPPHSPQSRTPPPSSPASAPLPLSPYSRVSTLSPALSTSTPPLSSLAVSAASSRAASFTLSSPEDSRPGSVIGISSVPPSPSPAPNTALPPSHYFYPPTQYQQPQQQQLQQPQYPPSHPYLHHYQPQFSSYPVHIPPSIPSPSPPLPVATALHPIPPARSIVPSSNRPPLPPASPSISSSSALARYPSFLAPPPIVIPAKGKYRGKGVAPPPSSSHPPFINQTGSTSTDSEGERDGGGGGGSNSDSGMSNHRHSPVFAPPAPQVERLFSGKGSFFNEMREMGFAVGDFLLLGYSIRELKSSFPSITLQDYLQQGFGIEQLKEEGDYTLLDFKVVGCSLAALKPFFTLKELYESGYSLRELKNAGFTPQEFRAIGLEGSPVNVVFETEVSPLKGPELQLEQVYGGGNTGESGFTMGNGLGDRRGGKISGMNSFRSGGGGKSSDEEFVIMNQSYKRQYGLEGSRILSDEMIDSLLQMIVKDYQSFTLLYRATREEFKGRHFHSHCDNQGASITIIKDAQGYIFGGYTSMSWTSPDSWVSSSDPSAFLFTLKNPHSIPPTKYPIKKLHVSRAIFCSITHGPLFGSDLEVYPNGTYRVRFPSCYLDTSGYGQKTFTGIGDACHPFSIVEIWRKNY